MSLFVQEEEEPVVKQVENAETTSILNIELSTPLAFQQSVVQELISDESSLLVLGQGLGVELITANLLHILSTPKKSLVILLGATEQENTIIEQELMEWWDGRSFSVVTADSYTVEKRRKLYTTPGIVSITSRILIVDLLSGILPPEKVTGVVLMHIEGMSELSSEAAIIDMYRKGNSWGFVKGITDAPTRLCNGFAPLDKKMRDFKLKRALLWPRFHLEVSSSLQSSSVIEIRVAMTETMTQIQMGLMSCLGKCIDELSRKNPALSTDYWCLENALDLGFISHIHAVLDPSWHLISYDSKALVRDIQTLLNLISCLVSYTSVSFYEMIQVILQANKPTVTKKYVESPWLMAEEAQQVISGAKKRVFYNNRYVLEELPKWEQLLELLKDCNSEGGGPILIMCRDGRIVRQLKRLLIANPRQLLIEQLSMYMTTDHTTDVETLDQDIQLSRAFVKQEVTSKRRRTRGAAVVAQVERIKHVENNDIDEQMKYEDVIALSQFEEPENDQMDTFSVVNGIIIEKYSSNIQLPELMPSHVILYEPDLAFIRQIELYKATHNLNTKVYFMYYGDSCEEQSHLNHIKKEKDAFLKLIREKSQLSSHYGGSTVPSTSLPTVASTRNAGGLQEEQIIVVDLREFRAALPGLLYRAGFRVVPVMLTVGDYVLSPKIVVERKSIPDLISSFKSGRLHEQCQKMSQHYEYPTLLIEFDGKQSFSFDNGVRSSVNPIGSILSQDDIQLNLAKLVMKFPRLRICWSSSPQQTVGIFMDLKLEREQPDPNIAVNIGIGATKSSADAEEVSLKTLLTIPGMTNIAYYNLTKACKTFESLKKMELEVLHDLIGEELANRVFEQVNSI